MEKPNAEQIRVEAVIGELEKQVTTLGARSAGQAADNAQLRMELAQKDQLIEEQGKEIEKQGEEVERQNKEIERLKAVLNGVHLETD